MVQISTFHAEVPLVWASSEILEISAWVLQMPSTKDSWRSLSDVSKERSFCVESGVLSGGKTPEYVLNSPA